MVNGISDFLDENRSVTKELIGDICSVSLESLRQVGASKAVSPAIWIVTGEAPDLVDVGLWGLGLAGGLIGVATMATGAIKAFVDDDVNARVKAVQNLEGKPYAEFIKPTLRYGFAGEYINAMTIAKSGGTAWLSQNIWVYITDARGRLVCDFKPKQAQTVLQPILPLRPAGDGYLWGTRRY